MSERPLASITFAGIQVGEKGCADIHDKQAKEALEAYLSEIVRDVLSRAFDLADPQPSQTYRVVTVEQIRQCLTPELTVEQVVQDDHTRFEAREGL